MKVCIVIMMFIAAIGCNNRNNIHTNWNSGYVNSLGKYINEQKDLSLDVYQEKGLLRYQIVIGKDTVLKSNENSSIYQRWFIYLSDDEKLWVESSDIGCWVWMKDDENIYRKLHLQNRPKDLKIPKPFLDSLPQNLKKILIN